jgi:hypothetical protein
MPPEEAKVVEKTMIENCTQERYAKFSKVLALRRINLQYSVLTL